MGLDVPDPVHLYHIRYRTGSGNLPGLLNVAGNRNKNKQTKLQKTSDRNKCVQRTHKGRE